LCAHNCVRIGVRREREKVAAEERIKQLQMHHIEQVCCSNRHHRLVSCVHCATNHHPPPPHPHIQRVPVKSASASTGKSGAASLSGTPPRSTLRREECEVALLKSLFEKRCG
jgi:hypothetical protein